MPELYDAVTVADTHMRRDGYLVADARIARTGIQVYLGRELGRPELGQVRVLRPEEEVFSQDAMASFAGRPVTMDHPSELVTAKNWKKYALGSVGSDIVRDGGSVRVPLMVADADAIAAVQGGKRELSAGYTCDIDWTAGKTADGQEYDAVQRNVRGNHLAIVTKGRAGPDHRIGDDNPENQGTNMKTLIIDGVSVEVSDEGVAVVTKLQKAVTDAATAKDAADGALAALKATHATEVASLKAQVLDAAALDAAIVRRTAVIDAARKLLGATYDATGKSDADVRRAAVTVKLGDAAVTGKSDDYVAAAFDTLTHAAVAAPVDPLRRAIATGPVKDSALSPYEESLVSLRDAWKGETQKKDA